MQDDSPWGMPTDMRIRQLEKALEKAIKIIKDINDSYPANVSAKENRDKWVEYEIEFLSTQLESK